MRAREETFEVAPTRARRGTRLVERLARAYITFVTRALCVWVCVGDASRASLLSRRVRRGCKRVQMAEHREETKHLSPSFD